jgi:SAM-dependent methyltransferase
VDPDEVAAAMAAASLDPATQLAQTGFRMSLVDGWGVPAGSSVLEIGCGQGDMTAVLAAAVGPSGRVVAVDSADPAYGAPVTIGESTDFLRASALGDRIDVRLGFDILSGPVPGEFDYVVLALSSWYFASLTQLRDVLRMVRPLASMLCFAEWDLRPADPGQLPHLLAVLVQGQLDGTEGNVRTPFSREALLRLLDETGWRVDRQRVVDTAGLADADWEIRACLDLATENDFLRSQVDLLRSLASDSGNRALPVYQILAR